MDKVNGRDQFETKMTKWIFFSTIMNASCFTHARNDPTCKDKCCSIGGKFLKNTIIM